MKFFLIMLRIRIKQIVSKKSYIMIMLMFPMFIALVMGYGNNYMGEISIKAGVYREGQMSELIANKLTKSESIQFVIYDTKEELEKDVATREVECGVILDEKLANRLSSGDFKEAITMIISQSTMSKGVLQETVVATIYETICSEMTYKLLVSRGYLEDSVDLKRWLEEKKEMYYDSGMLMEIDFINISNELPKTNDVGVYETLKLSRGIVAVFLMISSIMMGINIIDQKKEISSIKSNMTVLVAYLLIESIMSIACIGIINMYVRNFEFFIYECIKLLMYLISINSIIILVSSICKSSYGLNSILPGAILATVIFCPIIMDITSMNIGIKYISYLILPYHYLSGNGNILILFLVSVICWISTLGVMRRQCR